MTVARLARRSCPICGRDVAVESALGVLRLAYHVPERAEHADGGKVACRGAGHLVGLAAGRGKWSNPNNRTYSTKDRRRAPARPPVEESPKP